MSESRGPKVKAGAKLRHPKNRARRTGIVYRRSVRVVAAFVVVITTCTLATSCDSASQSYEEANGWITNCTGPDFDRFSSGSGAGPGPDRPVFKIRDPLVLAVPKQNWPSTISIDAPPRECRKLSDLTAVPFLYFVISGKWSQGYKPEDVLTVNGTPQFQPDVVTVRIEPSTQERQSAKDKEKLKEEQRKWNKEFTSGTREFGGLTCYTPKPPNPFSDCSGKREPSDPDIVDLRYRDYAATPFVLVQAQYTSTRYGGIDVYWQAWILGVSHALDIDATIWKSIEKWNLESTAKTADR